MPAIILSGGVILDYLKMFAEMISFRGLTAHTLKVYSSYLRFYLDYLKNELKKDPNDVTWEELRTFVNWLQKSRGLSDRSINCCIAQLHFFTIYVLHKPWDSTQLPTRKFDTFLPYVPSQEEVHRFISTIPDLKVKAMVSLLYSSGLRVGEVCHLQYENVSRKNMTIHILHSKNRSDRYACLSEHALQILTQYWYTHGRPKAWLFPKQRDPSKPIDPFYLSRNITLHEQRLGWPHRLTCHSFRHAFGTHLYQNGTDLLTIKALLGHKSIRSTTIYVHLAESLGYTVSNPFDALKEET